MNNTIQESAGGQDYRIRNNLRPISQSNASHSTIMNEKLGDFTLNKRQIGFGSQDILYCLTIELAIRLGARPLHGRPLPPIKQAKLNASSISCATHNAIHGIDFTHQMAFSQPTNGGITGHDANSRQLHCQQGCICTRARCRGGCFRSSVTSADHDHIKMFHVKHPHFPIQKLEKISPRRSSTSTRPTNISKLRTDVRSDSETNSSGTSC